MNKYRLPEGAEPPPPLARTPDGTPLRDYTAIHERRQRNLPVAPPLTPEVSLEPNQLEFQDPKLQKRPRHRRSRPVEGLIPWPIAETGAISGGPWPSPPAEALAPEALGSLDWWAQASLGSSEEAIRLLESLISGQGLKAPQNLVRVAKIFREWQRQYSLGQLSQPPTLNQACQALGQNPTQIISFLQSGISSLALMQSQVRLALGTPRVVAAAVAAATDPATGFQDRKLIFEATGLITKGSGPAVVINNSNNQIASPLATAPAILQNISDMIDADVREAEAIDAEIED